MKSLIDILQNLQLNENQYRYEIDMLIDNDDCEKKTGTIRRL